MTMMVLDDTPRWVAYLLTAFCLGGFVWAIIDLVPRRRLSSELPGSLWSIRRKNYSLLLLICMGFMIWLLASTMFFRFHAVAIGPDRIELVYLCPRPAQPN